ncbi:hypothetical protein Tco_0800967 [Tanacetum coccineum]|uniref:Uncharacterized protein n=1 Tax=Tanacetum coccineum TaxID=301880 RepID=A0ABQ4ZUM5_9ASTR
MEANNSINRSDIQRQLYKALVDAYEADKILLDTYGDTVTIKRPRDGADDDQEPFAGTDRGSKRRRSGKEPASTSAPRETTTTTAERLPTTGSKISQQLSSQSAPVENYAIHDVFEAHAHYWSFENRDYGHIKWIEDLVPNSMWSQVIVHYDKFALWGVSHWGKKRRQFYAFAITRESARDVYSKRRIVDCLDGGNCRMLKTTEHLEWNLLYEDEDILY